MIKSKESFCVFPTFTRSTSGRWSIADLPRQTARRRSAAWQKLRTVTVHKLRVAALQDRVQKKEQAFQNSGYLPPGRENLKKAARIFSSRRTVPNIFSIWFQFDFLSEAFRLRMLRTSTSSTSSTPSQDCRIATHSVTQCDTFSTHSLPQKAFWIFLGRLS